MKLDIVISAEDLASNKFQKVDKELQKVSKASVNVDRSFHSVQASSKALVSAFRKIAVEAAAVFSAFQVSKSFIQVNAQFERFQTTLETLYKSHSKAQAVFDSILQFASKTPFEVDQLTEAWVRMKAMGLEPNLDMFKKIGDAVSALGGSQETFNGIVIALGQIQAKGKLSAEELMQLAERGVPVFEILQEKLGITKEELSNIGNEGIDASKAINALVEGMGEKFEGNMEKMSNTWQGIISNLKDDWTRFMKLVGDTGIFSRLKEALKTLQDKIQKAFDSGQAQKWANVIGKSFSIVATVLKDISKIIWEYGASVYDIGKVIFLALNKPFTLAYDYIKKMFTEDGYFEKVIMSIPYYFKAIGKIIITILPDAILKALELTGLQIVKWSTIAFKPLVVAFAWVKDNMIAFGKNAIDKLGELFHNLKVSIQNVFIKMFNFIAEKFNSFIQSIANGLEKIPFMEGAAKKLKEFKITMISETNEAYQAIFSDNEKAYKSFLNVQEQFSKDWAGALDYINQRSSELTGELDKDVRKTINILKTEGGEYGKFVGSVVETMYEAGGKSWSIIKERFEALKNLTKSMSPELQKQFEELNQLINKNAENFKKQNEKNMNVLENQTKKTTEKMKGFWESFFESVSKNPFWKKLIDFSKKAWSGIKSVFSGGAKEGETGIVARTKNAIQSIMSGASAGGIIGAEVSFLTDQLMQNEKIRNALSKIFEVLQKILEPIASVIAPVLEALAPLIESFKPVFNLIAELLRPVAWLLRQIVSGITKVINFFTSVAEPVWKSIKSVLDVIKDIISGIKNVGKTIGKGVKGILNSNPITTIGGLIKWHSGGPVKPVVAHDGMYIGDLRRDEVPAVLQQGEYVINRQATQKYRHILEAINENRDVKKTLIEKFFNLKEIIKPVVAHDGMYIGDKYITNNQHKTYKSFAWTSRRIATGITKVINNFFTSVAKPDLDGTKKALDIIKSIIEAIKGVVTSSLHLNVGLPASSWNISHSTGVTCSTLCRHFASQMSAQFGRMSLNKDNLNLKQNLKNIKSFSSHLLKDRLSRDLSVKDILNLNPIMTIGGLVKWHFGGIVQPVVAHSGIYTGDLRSNEVPAVLQQGEYVINRRATQKYRPVLEAINSGKNIKAGDTNITINVYADNFDRRFVEDELIPLLEQAHKRGKLRWE